MRTLTAFLLFCFAVPSAIAGELVWKTETSFLKELGPLGECKADDDECLQADHVGYASISHYGRTYYLTYEEAHRAYVSFDASLEENRDTQFVFSLEQIAPGAFDWGGIIENGKFKPLYVIKRFYEPGFDWSADHVDRNKSGLYVWRLSNPPTASITESIGLATENAKARELAENDFQSLGK